MKLNKKILFGVIAAGTLAAGMTFASMAADLGSGQWCDEGGTDASKRYWFAVESDGSKFLANTWHWVKDADNTVRCYYFDKNGWLAVNTTIDGETVDATGAWVKDGIVQTNPSADYYSHNGSFLGSTAAKAETSAPVATADNVTSGPGTGSAVTATATSASSGKKTSNKAYKAAGAGPGDVVDTLDYTLSAINGQSVSNSWANFSMDLSGLGKTMTAGDIETRFDFMADCNGSTLTVLYIPLNYYGTGDLASFVSAYAKDAKTGVKNGTIVGDVTLGNIAFKQINKEMATPVGNYNDATYLRLVDGTNYVQVIMIQQNGEGQDFLTALNTIRKVR